MIRRHQNRRRTDPLRRCGALLPVVALVAAVTGLGACSTSKLLVGTVYDRADDKVLDKVDDWVDLTDAQRQELEAYIGTFHTWHRRHELPRYAALMREVATGLSTWDQATPADFKQWFGKAADLAQASRECHPARFATPLMRSLSDVQVDRIERHWIEQRDESRAENAGESREQRIGRRVDKLDTWIGRMGLELDDDQLELLRDEFLQQKSLRDRYHRLTDDWSTRLFSIARDQDATGYDALLEAHVDAWFGRIEKAYPAEFQANRQHWLDFAIRFEKTFSRLQRRELLSWLNDMAGTLDAVSRDTAEWLPADDPAYGCIVERGGSASG